MRNTKFQMPLGLDTMDYLWAEYIEEKNKNINKVMHLSLI
jgi:hypothetical protein